MEIKHGMVVQRKMTREDFQKAAGGGVNFGKDNKYLAEIFVDSFLEWGGPGYYLKNEEIGRLYKEKFEPLMVGHEAVDPKKKIIKKIFEKWPMALKVIKRENGKVSRMIEGVKIKDVLLSPVKLMERKEEEIKLKKQAKKKEQKEKIRKKRKIKNQKPLTPYDIVGPCPGEDPSFSAFDYLRKKPIIGWDSPEKQEWFKKIMGEISKK